MIREKSISVHEVKVTLIWVWKALAQALNLLRCVKAQKITEPLLDRVIITIPDWLIQLYFLELSTWIRLSMLLGLLIVILSSILLFE